MVLPDIDPFLSPVILNDEVLLYTIIKYKFSLYYIIYLLKLIFFRYIFNIH
jgi:hypothetical protein